jgi:hypothetical protein
MRLKAGGVGTLKEGKGGLDKFPFAGGGSGADSLSRELEALKAETIAIEKARIRPLQEALYLSEVNEGLARGVQQKQETRMPVAAAEVKREYPHYPEVPSKPYNPRHVPTVRTPHDNPLAKSVPVAPVKAPPEAPKFGSNPQPNGVSSTEPVQTASKSISQNPSKPRSESLANDPPRSISQTTVGPLTRGPHAGGSIGQAVPKSEQAPQVGQVVLQDAQKSPTAIGPARKPQAITGPGTPSASDGKALRKLEPAASRPNLHPVAKTEPLAKSSSLPPIHLNPASQNATLKQGMRLKAGGVGTLKDGQGGLGKSSVGGGSGTGTATKTDVEPRKTHVERLSQPPKNSTETRHLARRIDQDLAGEKAVRELRQRGEMARKNNNGGPEKPLPTNPGRDTRKPPIPPRPKRRGR